MAPDSETDRDADQPDDMSALAREVVRELDPGTVIDDKVVLSKRQIAAVLAGPATLAGVLGLSAGEARAQSSGQLGAPDAPIEAFLSNYGAESTASGYDLTIEGDTWQFNE